MVLGTSMQYEIAEVVDPQVNIVAKVSKSVLSQLHKLRNAVAGHHPAGRRATGTRRLSKDPAGWRGLAGARRHLSS